ncbi:MAG TPA: RnfABCDGE type electron transport complex subunit D [Pyrinomonadaceae bacterium]|nr:RnfABCDGE type electron transport complex subunit D [Pyrinomonadaceae bacterium]
MSANEGQARSDRLGGLRRFAVAITILNLLGHAFFGFEQSLAQPLVALATSYAVELLLEAADAWGAGRAPRFRGGGARGLVEFLLSAHITGLACAMLLYANERLWPVAFAAAAAICSKSVLRARVGGGARHFFNPSNFGITVTLLLFPWVGIAPPYQFTENLTGAGDWILPAVIVLTGTFLNFRFTHKLPLIAGWLGGFVAQAALRSLLLETPFAAALVPMTGVAFILYTFYMVTDPATTPAGAREQVAFGASVAAVYGLLMVSHVVFGLFFALTIVCALRGAGLYAAAWAGRRAVAPARASAPARAVGEV